MKIYPANLLDLWPDDQGAAAPPDFPRSRSLLPALYQEAPAALSWLAQTVKGVKQHEEDVFDRLYRRGHVLSGMAALLVLIIAGIASMFFHFMTPDTYSWLTLGIFTLLTVGDFARIRAGGDGQSAVSLSLSIYLDAINIFLAVLQLFGGRRRN